MRFTAWILLAAGAALPVTAWAERADAPLAEEVFALGVIEVIGKREPAPTRLTVESVDAGTLRALHRNELATALDLFPGVTLQNVGQRRERLVSVRGFSSRQVPLFIDGVPVYVPYDGNVDFARFGVDYVAEVNVSKGLASVLYGPNILGGAINVISQRPSQPLQWSAELEQEFDDDGGSMATRAVGSLGGMQTGPGGRWYGHVTASYVDADGYRLPDDFVPTPNEDGSERENADAKDTVVSAKVGYLSAGGDEYALSYYRQDGEKNSPPYAGSAPGVQARFWQWPQWDKESLYFVARNEIGEQGTLRWRVYHDEFYNVLNSYDDASYSSFTRPFAFEGSVYDDYTNGAIAEYEWRWSEANATRVALHFKQDVHRERDETDSPQEEFEDRSYAAAIEHEWRVTPQVVLTPGFAYTAQDGRQADNLVDGVIVPFETDKTDASNAQLTALWEVDADRALLAGISQKTRFPTLKDRFSFRMGSAIPNPGLEAETATHYEIAWRQSGDRWDLRAALFQSDIDDAIENVTIDASLCSAPNPTCFQQRNVGRQRNRGIELSGTLAPIDQIRVEAQVTLLDRDNLSSPDIRPIDTPEEKYRIAAEWLPAEAWSLRADAQYESRRFSTTDGTRVADSFTLANLFLRYTGLPRLGIELGVRNLADELYAYQEGFYEPGRSWFAQLDYRY